MTRTVRKRALQAPYKREKRVCSEKNLFRQPIKVFWKVIPHRDRNKHYLVGDILGTEKMYCILRKSSIYFFSVRGDGKGGGEE